MEKINQEFYDAIQQLSISRMERLWLHEEWVKCIHPGWELIQGWTAIRDSWESIFRNTQSMQIAVTQIAAHVEGDIGIVACTENISSYFTEGMRSGLALATNLYLRRENRWFMVLHHASPVPLDESVLLNETVQ